MIESVLTTGEAHPETVVFTFHARFFDSDHWRGILFAMACPCFPAPRNSGQR
jgi:hypothetical protein